MPDEMGTFRIDIEVENPRDRCHTAQSVGHQIAGQRYRSRRPVGGRDYADHRQPRAESRRAFTMRRSARVLG